MTIQVIRPLLKKKKYQRIHNKGINKPKTNKKYIKPMKKIILSTME